MELIGTKPVAKLTSYQTENNSIKNIKKILHNYHTSE